MLKKLPYFILFILSLSTYAQAPELDATGDQLYCPGSEIAIVEDFTLDNTSGTAINSIYIQISSGYEQGRDFLRYNGSNAAITPSFTSSKLPSLPVVPVIASVSFAKALANSYCAYLILFGIVEQLNSTLST